MNSADYARILGQYAHGCVFCSADEALVLTEGDRFGVLFDPSPLVAGHLIIYSREHHACAGEVPRPEVAELDRLRLDVTRLVRDRFGAATLYEHGRAGHCLSDGPEHRLCHHFHLHVVPGDIDVSDRLCGRFDQVALARYGDITDVYEQYGDYLYLETDDGHQRYFVVDQPIERHLMRTLISERIGHPERASWRDHADRALLVEGMASLRTSEIGLAAARR
jgi:diadenosine tetraphosphate (Ap4A) HIT family hydrolase